MNKNRIVLFFIALSISTAHLLAQPVHDRTELEKERKQIQDELAEAQRSYNKLKGESKQALGQLAAVNKKISLQQSYINNINKELKFLEDDIYLSNLEIYRLQRQLDTLKSEYAKTIVYAYKNRSSYNYLNFIFSAKSFNDAMKRIKYLKSYHSYRERQMKTIVETRGLISKRQEQQKARISQQSDALLSNRKEKEILDAQRKEKDEVVKGLKGQEKDLEKLIAAKKKRDNEVKNAITAIIKRIQKEEEEKAKALAKQKAEEERIKKEAEDKIAAANKAAEEKAAPPVASNTNTPPPAPKPAEVKKEPAKPVSYFELNEKDIALGSEFSSNRGKLPWPVDNGIVTIGFGAYSIEGTLLKGDNPGVTIAAEIGKTVKAVFDGEVVGVHSLGGGVAMVIVRHGKYFTTYSNITSVTLSRGDKVKTGHPIGKVGVGEDGNGVIDFILMIESKNVNPQQWLR